MVATVLQVISVGFLLGTIGVVPLAMLNRAMAFRKVALAQTAGAVSGTVVGESPLPSPEAKLEPSQRDSHGNDLWSRTLALWVASPFRVKAVFRPR